MAQNMYRVGDYVYFEVYPSSPYQIRRIEELNKTIHGTVEAKVICFYRRRDLPQSLLKIADQAERQNQILSRPKRSLLSRSTLASTSNGGDIKSEVKRMVLIQLLMASKRLKMEKLLQRKTRRDIKPDVKNERSFGFAGLPLGADALSCEQVHALRQRELFLSRQIETLPATQIRGKCAVVILNEVETCDMYLEREDAFFYSLVYDPGNHTLLADKGKIETVRSGGIRRQQENGELMVVEEDEDQEQRKASSSAMNDRDIDQFLIIARAVGTFSRALDSSSL
uniref:BAH domain-containing protein n=1 Tax=Ditylenchus dipsaci TaxID=166011 RepID=A0A915D1B9_9BILA